MFWTVFGLSALAIIVFLCVVLWFVCRKLFEIAIVRGRKMELGDGFQNQLAQYKHVWEKGKALYVYSKETEN